MRRRPAGLARTVRSEAWQEDVWRYYDEVGELRFAIGWVSNGLSRINLIAAREPATLGDEPAPIDVEGESLSQLEQDAVDLVAAIAGGQEGQSAVLAHLATLLSVPGVGWVLIEEALPDDGDLSTMPVGPRPGRPGAAWSWRVLSNEELRESGEQYEVMTVDGEWRPLAPGHVLIKVWRPHPRRSTEADSPCRAARTVLSEITMLDEHVIATAQSRLAGAGLLVLPSEIEFKPMIARTGDEASTNGEPVEDDFADVLVETMTVPIGDRGSAAAIVPLTVKIPGEYVDKVKHITFWSEFSESLGPLQERAIKRLALALDMPPEIVTGVSGMNHWGAWQVQEEAVTLHIEPLAEIIVEAFTIGYLRPALAELGHDEADIAKLLVFYSAQDLTIRPDRSDDALAAYDRIELSGAALRRESGLREADKPSPQERAQRLMLRSLDRAPDLAGQLLPALGVDVDIEQPSVESSPTTPTETTPESPNLGPPDDDDAEPEPVAASVIVAACDGLVHRALERAGSRLKARVGRDNGGSAVVEAGELASVHTRFDATSFAPLDHLLGGSWDRVPEVADRLGLEADRLTLSLDDYVRHLIASGRAHTPEQLAESLGLVAGATR